MLNDQQLGLDYCNLKGYINGLWDPEIMLYGRDQKTDNRGWVIVRMHSAGHWRVHFTLGLINNPFYKHTPSNQLQIANNTAKNLKLKKIEYYVARAERSISRTGWLMSDCSKYYRNEKKNTSSKRRKIRIA